MTAQPIYGVDAVRFALCTDCVAFVANGQTPEDDGGDFVERFEEHTEGLSLSVGDGETFFSWQSCEGCGSMLAGDRIDSPGSAI